MSNEEKPVVKRGRGRPRKDPYADLPKEWCAQMEGALDEEIRAVASKVALDEVLNKRLKSEDLHLKEKQLEAKEAGEQYADATKVNTLKLVYLRLLLELRGKESNGQ
jgi:hypothetical protein